MDDTDLRHRSGILASPESASPESVPCWACGSAAAPDHSWSPVQFHRCAACGLLFTPHRSIEELQSLYDSTYFDEYASAEGYEDDPDQRRYEAQRRIAFLRRYCDSGRLLEIGAATGYFLEAARQSGFEPMGVEPAEDLARRATARLGLPVIAGFIEDVALPMGWFDVACAWHVVEHLREPDHSLVRVRRAVRAGGHVFVEVPNIASVYARRRRTRWAPLDIRHHVGHYTPAALRALLERSGFRVLAVESFPMRGYLRPGRALRPIEIAAALKETLLVRANPRRPHPWRHEALRAVAVVPDAVGRG